MNVIRIGKFAMVGAVNTGIDLALFTLLVSSFSWPLPPANIVSYGTGILNSFFVNKYWTFRDPTPLSRSFKPGVKFVLVNLIGLLISTVTVLLLARWFTPVVSKVLSVGVVFVWNYRLSDLIVFSLNVE